MVKGKKGQFVLTSGADEAALARGIYDTYLSDNLRYSQMAPLDMYREVNTGTNLPAEIEINAVDGNAYKFLFMAKGGGSANKSYLFQETKALLNPHEPAGVRGPEDGPARHLRLPAVPPRRGHRRHVGRVHAEDRQAGLGPLPRLAPARGQRPRPGLPRRRARGRHPQGLPGVRASAPSSAASTSATTCGSSASPATAPRARSPSPCRAPPTARPWARSPPRACSSSSSSTTPPSTCPRSPTTTSTTTSCASTSTSPWTRSAPPSPSCR